MTFTFDRATDVGKVRVLVPDEDDDATNRFEDEDMQVFLDLNGSDVLPAAAQALERIAGDELLLFKRVKIDVIEVDGPALQRAYAGLAKRYRDTFDDQHQAGDIQIAELVVDHRTLVERLHKEWLRET